MRSDDKLPPLPRKLPSPKDGNGLPLVFFGYPVLRRATPDDLGSKSDQFLSSQNGSHLPSNPRYNTRLFAKDMNTTDTKKQSIHHSYYLDSHQMLDTYADGFLCLHPSGHPVIIKKIIIPSEKGIIHAIAIINPSDDNKDVGVYIHGSNENPLYITGLHIHEPEVHTQVFFYTYGLGPSTGNTVLPDDFGDACMTVLKKVAPDKHDVGNPGVHITGHSAAVMALRNIARRKIQEAHDREKHGSSGAEERSDCAFFPDHIKVSSIKLTGSPENLAKVAVTEGGKRSLWNSSSRQCARFAVGKSWINDRHDSTLTLLRKAFCGSDTCPITSETIHQDEVISSTDAFQGDSNETVGTGCPKSHQPHANPHLYNIDGTIKFDHREGQSVDDYLIDTFQGICPTLVHLDQNYERDDITTCQILRAIRSDKFYEIITTSRIVDTQTI